MFQNVDFEKGAYEVTCFLIYLWDMGLIPCLGNAQTEVVECDLESRLATRHY